MWLWTLVALAEPNDDLDVEVPVDVADFDVPVRFEPTTLPDSRSGVPLPRPSKLNPSLKVLGAIGGTVLLLSASGFGAAALGNLTRDPIPE